MAKMLYKITINNPSTDVGAFPPSVMDHLKTMVEWLAEEKDVEASDDFEILFDSEDELNSFLTRFAITDPQLVADIATWKAEYGITYVSEIYRLDLTDVNGLF